MSATLNDCLKAIQDIVGRVPGIRAAPEYASDKVPPGPWAMAFPISGTMSQEYVGILQGLHNIGLYVVTARVDLPATLKAILPMGELVTAALEKEVTLLDTCDTFGKIDYAFNFALNVGTPSAPAYVTGWFFTITDVKIQDTTSLAA